MESLRAEAQANLFGEIVLGGDLEPSATYRHRSWSWIPAAEGEGYAGKLLIRVQGGKRLSSKCEIDEYAVELLPPAPGFIGRRGRRFQLSNLTDPDAAEVYEVHATERPGEGRCNCPCGKYQRFECKHESAVRAAMLAGAFESNPDPVFGSGGESA